MSAKPISPLDDPAPVPVNITWSEQNGYQMNPQNPHSAKKGSFNFNATNKSCKVIFNPSNTELGASITVPTGPPLNVPVGDSDYTVTYCICDPTGSCIPPQLNRLADDNTGTIKVGSGGGAGDGRGHKSH